MGLEVHKAVKAIEPLYIPLARAALWVTSLVLAGVILHGVYQVARYYEDTTTPHLEILVQACQVLALITLAVLGYRGHKGD